MWQSLGVESAVGRVVWRSVDQHLRPEEQGQEFDFNWESSRCTGRSLFWVKRRKGLQPAIRYAAGRSGWLFSERASRSACSGEVVVHQSAVRKTSLERIGSVLAWVGRDIQEPGRDPALDSLFCVELLRFYRLCMIKSHKAVHQRQRECCQE